MHLAFEKDLTLPLKCDSLQEDFKTYQNVIIKIVENNINLLKELPAPNNFTLEEILSHFEEAIKTDLENDVVFEKTFEVGKYAQTMAKSMRKYFDNIYTLNKEKKEKNICNLLAFSKLFLNSNLREDFLETVSASYLVENDFLDIFDKRITKEHKKLLLYKNNRSKFEKVCEEHNQWVRKLADKKMLVGNNRTKLVWYVKINNANTVEELFDGNKFLMEEKVDPKVLEELITNVAKVTEELEKLVLANLDHLQVPEFDDGVKIMSDVMNMLA